MQVEQEGTVVRKEALNRNSKHNRSIINWNVADKTCLLSPLCSDHCFIKN